MSNVHFNVLAGFKAIDAWQQNIIRNAQGILQPGFQKTRLSLGGAPGGNGRPGQTGTAANGGRNPMGGGDTLMVGGTQIEFRQGDIDPARSSTSLAIRGNGFFLLAENLNPGARVFLTRGGDFRYDAQGRLVNSQGLFVVGGNGTLTDPPTPVLNPGDGSVVLPQLTLGKVNNPSNLALSGYGSTVYSVTDSAGALQAFANGSPEVGFVQPNSLERLSPIGHGAEIQFESTLAQNTYKMFKECLDNYNKCVDDAIQTVK